MLGKSKASGVSTKENWWWNEGVQAKLRLEREREREGGRERSLTRCAIETMSLTKIVKR